MTRNARELGRDLEREDCCLFVLPIGFLLSGLAL